MKTLFFARRRLVYPRHHVAGVAQRIMGMKLYRTRCSCRSCCRKDQSILLSVLEPHPAGRCHQPPTLPSSPDTSQRTPTYIYIYNCLHQELTNVSDTNCIPYMEIIGPVQKSGNSVHPHLLETLTGFKRRHSTH